MDTPRKELPDDPVREAIGKLIADVMANHEQIILQRARTPQVIDRPWFPLVALIAAVLVGMGSAMALASWLK